LDFEELTIEPDGTFRSFLHQRPFDSGRWEIKDGSLVLTADGMGSYRIDTLRRRATSLAGMIEGKPVKWELIP